MWATVLKKIIAIKYFSGRNQELYVDSDLSRVVAMALCMHVSCNPVGMHILWEVHMQICMDNMDILCIDLYNASSALFTQGTVSSDVKALMFINIY